MKKILLMTSLPFLVMACNSNEFKETKIAPQATSQVSNNVDLSSKELPPGHPAIDGKAAPAGGTMAEIKVENITKAKGGITIAEAFEKTASRKNAKVIIRGKIVKYNSGIMGKNWIHLRDGTGTADKNDLVITTEQNAKLNDTITASGTLQYDRDIGSGYFFPVIIENANVKVE